MMVEPKQIQWILCDLGKTLVNFDHQKIGERLLKLIHEQNPGTNANPLMLYAWFFLENNNGITRNTEIDTGRLSIEQIWAQFSEEFHVNVSFDEFDRIWFDIFSDQQENVIKAMKVAQKKEIHVAICSSTNASHWKHVLEKYPAIASITEKAFLTFEMGMMKTDSDFFPSIIDDLKVEPSNILFIDDREDNLESARKARIHALLYEDSLPDWTIFSE